MVRWEEREEGEEGEGRGRRRKRGSGEGREGGKRESHAAHPTE